MKKLLALTLALVLACSLCVPALAAEDEDVHVVYGEEATAQDVANDDGELKDIADESPEVQALLQEMYDEGLLQENTDYDLSYFEDGDGIDPVDQYIADHPEEMAALDADALLDGWGYQDPREEFMDYWDITADAFEETVVWQYAINRVEALENAALAEEYKTEYPEDWAAFDAYRYFNADVQSDYEGAESVESYMAYHNLLSEDEFIDVMFARCIAIYACYDPADWEYTWDGPAADGEPTLTLVVNGVASDIPVAAEEGVSYADAAALRGILGPKAAAPTYEGAVPIREAAENAGWEVEWYDGGWRGLDQQVCLWNKDAFVAEVQSQVEAYQKFLDAAKEFSHNALFTEEPKRATQTVTVAFKRFNSLDGDKTYNLRFRTESVWQKGVVDSTVTFDVSPLLEMFPADELESMAQGAGLTLSELKALFSAGKAEFIFDYNAGGYAYNIPLLGLMDEDLEGWQTMYIPELLAYSQESDSYAETLYEGMRSAASWRGGVAGREDVDTGIKSTGVTFGPDNVHFSGSTVTWTLETDKVNAAISKLIGDGDKAYSFFKKCDLTMTFDDQGETDLVVALRPDTDGIAEAAMADVGETNVLGGSFLRWLLGGFDMELTANTHSDSAKSTGTIKLHAKNFGVFDVSTQSTTKSAAQGPRQMAEVERAWVTPAAGSTVTVAR